MIDRLLDTFAPHICCSCGAENALLCENCIFDIVDEPFSRCVECLKPTTQDNCCRLCRSQLGADGVWVVGERSTALKKLINRYKFEHARDAARIISELVLERLPELPPATRVMYIPDIPAHRRQRGYDHMRRLAQTIARGRGLGVSDGLRRETWLSQRGLGRRERLKRQHGAFVADMVDDQSPVLLIDDIYTTGATIRAGIAALRDAGVATIYVAVVARQPLDDSLDL